MKVAYKGGSNYPKMELLSREELLINTIHFTFFFRNKN